MSKEPQLGGVVRVRRIRERDSRTGLTAALTEEHDAAARVTRIEEQLATLPEPGLEDVASFAARQHVAAALGAALAAARAELEATRRITLAARDRWRSDRSRLAAVESLVERRAEARRAEQRRRDGKEMDEIAGDIWRRTHEGEAAG
ncbi:flagellar FliJ family protein [Nocardioides aquiterrae]|uniref:Flagellar FliJ protein n=1 Tax=Nocardioides aquiterrae TaxID=203799 RepID=A0ABN1UBR0_9ACTN